MSYARQALGRLVDPVRHVHIDFSSFGGWRRGLSHVPVADTAAQRERGLRGWKGRNPKMLFVMSPNAPAVMTMKDMTFPLDMLFIRDGFVQRVVTAQPGTIVRGPPSDYVLEAPADFAALHGISVSNSYGTSVSIAWL